MEESHCTLVKQYQPLIHYALDVLQRRSSQRLVSAFKVLVVLCGLVFVQIVFLNTQSYHYSAKQIVDNLHHMDLALGLVLALFLGLVLALFLGLVLDLTPCLIPILVHGLLLLQLHPGHLNEHCL